MSFHVDLRTHEIVRNAIRCRRCNTVIESESAHDFKRCPCGAVAVDGGRHCLNRSGTEFEELAVVRERS
jgi:Zn finger protein HypA/HybF involved in hydrogenase expression